jgi:Protein of unknown function (DUF2934)
MRNTSNDGTEITTEETTAMDSNFNEVAALAYRLWNERGCPLGSPEEDWFRAEQELSGRHETSAATA